jgi:sec-independent protein translocase protein TatA
LLRLGLSAILSAKPAVAAGDALPRKEFSRMGTLSVWHWLIFLVIAVLLFGGSGKISSIMGDVAKGIKSFKKGMTEEEDVAAPAEGPKKLEGKPPEPQAHSASSTTSGTKVG